MTNHAGPATHYLDGLGSTIGVTPPTPVESGVRVTIHSGAFVGQVTLTARGASAVADLLAAAVVDAGGSVADLSPEETP